MINWNNSNYDVMFFLSVDAKRNMLSFVYLPIIVVQILQC